jgi:cell division protein ZipA
MDNFRWILLAVGIVIIVVIYLISRKNKREFHQYDDDPSEDLPELKSNWDDLDEGVGEVRIVARADDVALPEDERSESWSDDRQDRVESEAFGEHDAIPVIEDIVEPAARYPSEAEAASAVEPVLEQEPESVPEPVSEPVPEPEQPSDEVREAVLVLNILAREGSTLSGKSINSVAHANDLVFGDMNIYHRMDNDNTSVFSMINMVKPGSFDPSTIHELETPGVSLFLQLPGPPNASEVFSEMLQTAYRMSETLEARLCDHRRQPLTESVVDQYRKTAASFDGDN